MKKHLEKEEYAAEIVNPVPLPNAGKAAKEGYANDEAPKQKHKAHPHHGGGSKAAATGKRYVGWIAVILALASLIYWPAVLGPAGAVIGFVAFLRGERALGIWSMVLGLLAVAVFLFLIPYYT